VSGTLPTSGWDVVMALRGVRESGSAFREQGLDALRCSARTRAAAVCIGG